MSWAASESSIIGTNCILDRLLGSFNNLQSSSSPSLTKPDVVFRVQGQPLYAHLHFLGLVSPTFAAMTQVLRSGQCLMDNVHDDHDDDTKDHDDNKDDSSEKLKTTKNEDFKLPEIVIKDFTFNAWHCYLHFLYTGFLDLADDMDNVEEMKQQLEELRLLAKVYADKEFEDRCEQFIEIFLDTATLQSRNRTGRGHDDHYRHRYHHGCYEQLQHLHYQNPHPYYHHYPNHGLDQMQLARMLSRSHRLQHYGDDGDDGDDDEDAHFSLFRRQASPSSLFASRSLRQQLIASMLNYTPYGRNPLLARLRARFEQPSGADVEFVVDGRTIKAHRQYLALVSSPGSEFHALLTSEPAQSRIQIETFTYTTFHAYIYYLYTGECMDTTALIFPSSSSSSSTSSSPPPAAWPPGADTTTWAQWAIHRDQFLPELFHLSYQYNEPDLMGQCELLVKFLLQSKADTLSNATFDLYHELILGHGSHALQEFMHRWAERRCVPETENLYPVVRIIRDYDLLVQEKWRNCIQHFIDVLMQRSEFEVVRPDGERISVRCLGSLEMLENIYRLLLLLGGRASEVLMDTLANILWRHTVADSGGCHWCHQLVPCARLAWFHAQALKYPPSPTMVQCVEMILETVLKTDPNAVQIYTELLLLAERAETADGDGGDVGGDDHRGEEVDARFGQLLDHCLAGIVAQVQQEKLAKSRGNPPCSSPRPRRRRHRSRSVDREVLQQLCLAAHEHGRLEGHAKLKQLVEWTFDSLL